MTNVDQSGRCPTDQPASPHSFVSGGLLTWAAIRRPDIALGLVALGALFTLIERARPLRRQPRALGRRGSGTDVVHFVVDEVVAAAGLVAVLAVLLPLSSAVVPVQIQAAVRAQPTWLGWVAR